MARFNTNGTLDTTFDGDGMARTDTGLQDLANGTAIQSDGKIVLVGTRQSADLQVMRYNTNGSLDTTFDGDGILQTDLGTSNEELHDVAIQSDGKILGVGGTFPFGPSPGDFALVRYNSNGALDTSFDGDGKVFADWGGRTDSPGENANAVTIQSNGRIVVAGQVPDATTTSVWRFAVARYLTNGSLDGSFDGDGKATMNVAGDNQPSTSGDVSADDVALTPSGGEIVVAGWSYPASYVETIARFNPDGTADTTFGQNGLANPSTCASPIGKLTGVAIQPNRRIVLAGHSCASPSGTAPVARLNGSSATITVTPNVEMNASGQTVEVHGAYWPEDTTVQIQQCNETNPASPVCVTVATAYTGFPGFGGFFATDNENPPSLTYAATGGSCPDPVCKIVVTAPNGEVVKAPISFKSTTSMSAAPSRGAIAQADAIQVGQTITVKANLSGGATAPTGSVSFFWCGPLLHPTTCSAGGTSFGSQPLTGTGGNGATATSGTVSFASPGRYCFRVSYPGDGTHRSATDSSRESCVSVRAAPGVGPLGADDFFEGIAGLQIQVGAPGVLQNDLSGPGLPPRHSWSPVPRVDP